jgi:hypothetical protein
LIKSRLSSLFLLAWEQLGAGAMGMFAFRLAEEARKKALAKAEPVAPLESPVEALLSPAKPVPVVPSAPVEQPDKPLHEASHRVRTTRATKVEQ